MSMLVKKDSLIVIGLTKQFTIIKFGAFLRLPALLSILARQKAVIQHGADERLQKG